jgi:hypothetical protein
MSDKAGVAAFVISILGASYQLISFALAYIVDRQFTYIYYIGLYSYFNSFSILVTFWAIGHLMAKQDSQRTTWPAIIFALGAANLTNLIVAWNTPVNTGFPLNNQILPNDIGLTLLPAPLLLIFGGIIGLIAARRPLQ